MFAKSEELAIGKSAFVRFVEQKHGDESVVFGIVFNLVLGAAHGHREV